MGRTNKCWAILHHTTNQLDGDRQWLEGIPDRTTCTRLFHSRSAARRYVADYYSCIANRPDLRAEPHGWRMPKVVPVVVEVRVVGRAA